MPKKICFVRLSALGDCIMMIPFVRTIQRAFPDSELTWITSKGLCPILEGFEGIQLLHVPKIRDFSSFLEAKSIVKELSFDLLLGTHASLSVNPLYGLIKAKRKVGFDRSRSRDGQFLFMNERIAPPKSEKHFVETYMDFATHIGIEELLYDGKIPLKEEELDWAEQMAKEPYCIIHPKSSSLKKDWPLSRYIEVSEYIRKIYGLKIYITGGIEDLPICSLIADRLGPSGENLAGKTPLPHLASLISKARFLLTPDTGPLHIGSAFQIPVIGLYAATSPKIFGPYFSPHFVIDKFSPRGRSKMEMIEVDEVIKMIHKVVDQ